VARVRPSDEVESFAIFETGYQNVFIVVKESFNVSFENVGGKLRDDAMRTSRVIHLAEVRPLRIDHDIVQDFWRHSIKLQPADSGSTAECRFHRHRISVCARLQRAALACAIEEMILVKGAAHALFRPGCVPLQGNTLHNGPSIPAAYRRHQQSTGDEREPANLGC